MDEKVVVEFQFLKEGPDVLHYRESKGMGMLRRLYLQKLGAIYAFGRVPKKIRVTIEEIPDDA